MQRQWRANSSPPRGRGSCQPVPTPGSSSFLPSSEVMPSPGHRPRRCRSRKGCSRPGAVGRRCRTAWCLHSGGVITQKHSTPFARDCQSDIHDRNLSISILWRHAPLLIETEFSKCPLIAAEKLIKITMNFFADVVVH